MRMAFLFIIIVRKEIFFKIHSIRSSFQQYGTFQKRSIPPEISVAVKQCTLSSRLSSDNGLISATFYSEMSGP
jgi:hypothetical protein